MPEPIPQALRIAVKNAVGGWGPYSVRGIDDLFNSYGFTEVDPSIQDAGSRRTAADRYQAKIDWSSPVQVRRYLDLVAEVLTNYPENPPAPPNSEGPRLRRVLRQLSIQPDDTGRLHLSAPSTEAPVASTEGVWPRGRLKLFLSHISKYRREVGAIARELAGYG